MILRRFTQHLKEQNWFAVGLDVIVVIAGVYIGLQVQDWAIEKQRLESEQQYLGRLHGEIEQLISTREMYNITRREASDRLIKISQIINDDDETVLTAEQCRTIAHSSFTTIPPADLPSITDLVSSGRLEQIDSNELRDSILSYVQDVARVRDLITLITEENVAISNQVPELLPVNYRPKSTTTAQDQDLVPTCDINKFRQNAEFLNYLHLNTYMYVIYTERGVLQLSEKLEELHTVLDKELNVSH